MTFNIMAIWIAITILAMLILYTRNEQLIISNFIQERAIPLCTSDMSPNQPCVKK